MKNNYYQLCIDGFLAQIYADDLEFITQEKIFLLRCIEFHFAKEMNCIKIPVSSGWICSFLVA